MSNPIAQTFTVPSTLAQGQDGIFVNQLDLFFQAGDPTFGITVDLRNTQQNAPNNQILPTSQVHLNANQISVSANASVATSFIWPNPIFLQAGNQYAFVITPDGNSPTPTVYTATVGQTDITHPSEIATNDWGQGSMFLPTSDTGVWVPTTNENIKFNIWQTTFTANTGSVTFTNANDEYLSLSTTNGNFIHGEKVFKFTNTPITGTVSYANTSYTITGNGTFFQNTFIIGSNIVLHNFFGPTPLGYFSVHKVTGIASNTSLTVDRYPLCSANGVAALSTPVGKLYMYDANSVSMHLTESTAANATFSYYPGDIVIGELSGAQAIIKSLDDRTYSYFQPLFYRTHVTGTNIFANVISTDTTFLLSNTYPLKFNDSNHFRDFDACIASHSHECQNNSGNKSLIIPTTLTTANTVVSPVIDTQSASIITYTNVINNDDRGENTRTGHAQARYISTIITLDPGLAAEDLYAYLTSYMPPNTNIEVYMRALNANDPQKLNEKSWTILGLQPPIVNSDPTNANNFIEYTYQMNQFPPNQLIGTIYGSNASANITGVGTTFSTGTTTSAVANGSIAIINNGAGNNAVFVVTAVNSDTSITLSGIPPWTFTGGSLYIFTDPNTMFLDPQNSNIASYFSNTSFYATYTTWQIKIDLFAVTPNLVPKVADIRAIALT